MWLYIVLSPAAARYLKDTQYEWQVMQIMGVGTGVATGARAPLVFELAYSSEWDPIHLVCILTVEFVSLWVGAPPTQNIPGRRGWLKGHTSPPEVIGRPLAGSLASFTDCTLYLSEIPSGDCQARTSWRRISWFWAMCPWSFPFVPTPARRCTWRRSYGHYNGQVLPNCALIFNIWIG